MNSTLWRWGVITTVVVKAEVITAKLNQMTWTTSKKVETTEELTVSDKLEHHKENKN